VTGIQVWEGDGLGRDGIGDLHVDWCYHVRVYIPNSERPFVEWGLMNLRDIVRWLRERDFTEVEVDDTLAEARRLAKVCMDKGPKELAGEQNGVYCPNDLTRTIVQIAAKAPA
jgi:hypothetical protein